MHESHGGGFFRQLPQRSSERTGSCSPHCLHPARLRGNSALHRGQRFPAPLNRPQAIQCLGRSRSSIRSSPGRQDARKWTLSFFITCTHSAAVHKAQLNLQAAKACRKNPRIRVGFLLLYLSRIGLGCSKLQNSGDPRIQMTYEIHSSRAARCIPHF